MRPMRILATTIICALILLTAVGIFIHSDEIDPLSYSLGAAMFLVMFLMPYFILVIAALTIAGLILDMRGVRRIWPYMILWTIPAGFFAVKAPIALPTGALTGVIYWALAGRVAGMPEWSLSNFSKKSFVAKAAAAVAAAYIAFVLAGWLVMGGKMLWVTAFDPPRGDPPFDTQFEHQMTVRMKVAMMDFPDAQSCVDQDAGIVTRGKLVPLDWSKIGSSAEANVCIFRLLAAYGDASASDEWLIGQGFRVGTGAFKNPHLRRDGKLQVRGSWFIREKGLRYVPRNFFFRALASITQSMGVIAVWSPDGETLLWVTLESTTL